MIFEIYNYVFVVFQSTSGAHWQSHRTNPDIWLFRVRKTPFAEMEVNSPGMFSRNGSARSSRRSSSSYERIAYSSVTSSSPSHQVTCSQSMMPLSPRSPTFAANNKQKSQAFAENHTRPPKSPSYSYSGQSSPVPQSTLSAQSDQVSAICVLMQPQKRTIC